MGNIPGLFFLARRVVVGSGDYEDLAKLIFFLRNHIGDAK